MAQINTLTPALPQITQITQIEKKRELQKGEKYWLQGQWIQKK
jgi:hypothetical protein